MYTHRINHKIKNLGLMLFCSMALPLVALSQQSPEKPCLRLRKVAHYLDALRQGSSYHVTLHFKTERCTLPMTLESAPAGRLQLRSDSDAELQIDKPSFVGSAMDEGTTNARELNVVFKVWASHDATIGTHMVSATMHYDAIGRAGNREEVLSIRIPIRVVAAGAEVKVHEDSPEDPLKLKWYQVVLLIAFFPIAFMIYLANEC